ncbi:MAG TPA: hypothetical protein PL063_04485, partial [Candidatus Cloacimonadota bacterium]|nr:hypothetical protein [Candidatus Cloacimonadota bacterium]
FKQRTTTHFLKHLQYCSMTYRPKQTFLLFNNTRQHTVIHLGFKAFDKQFHGTQSKYSISRSKITRQLSSQF